MTEAHVRAAKERAEINRFADLIRGTPILYALSRLHQTREDSEFSSKTVYDAYQEVAGELEVDTVAERRVRQLMQELAFLNVIDSSKVSRGRGRGVTAKYRRLEDADIVQTVLERDERLEALA